MAGPFILLGISDAPLRLFVVCVLLCTHDCRQHQEAFKPWHQLCSRLNFLVTEVLRYVTIDVLEPLWGGMRVAMRQATSIDEVGAVLCTQFSAPARLCYIQHRLCTAGGVLAGPVLLAQQSSDSIRFTCSATSSWHQARLLLHTQATLIMCAACRPVYCR
jgi:hypothetical protein